MATKKLTYEQSIERLLEIVSEMENPETPLEKSVKLYKEAVNLTKFCKDRLEEAEKEVKILERDFNDVIVEKPFDVLEDEDELW